MEATQSTEEFVDFESFSEEELSDDVKSEESDEFNDDWSKELPEDKAPQKEKVKDDLKVLDDSEADEDGELIDKKEDKKEKKEEKKKEEKEEEKEEVEAKEEEDKEEKKSAKNLRMRMGEELYNVDANATFKVKVDGEQVEVPLQELINNYSGKTAWDKKFTEIGKEKKYIEAEKKGLVEYKSKVEGHVKAVNEILSSKDKNPMDALLYLVEMSGQDPYNAYKRMMEANLEELDNLLNMTEVERELYFHKKKDELYSSVTKKREESMKKELAFNQVLQKIDNLRKSYNVSEDEFVDASEELEALYTDSKLDPNQITDEQIVEYASLKPHIAKVKEMIEPFEENISESKYGDIVATLSRSLRDKELDEAAILKLLKRNYSVDEDVKELNTKVYKKESKKVPSKVVDREESDDASFDDFEF